MYEDIQIVILIYRYNFNSTSVFFSVSNLVIKLISTDYIPLWHYRHFSMCSKRWLEVKKRDFTGAKGVDQKAISLSMPIDGKFRVGLYFNPVSKQIGYIINGTNYGYLHLIAENALKNPNPNYKFLGKTVSVQYCI